MMKVPHAGESLAVVRCYISPEAARKRALEKLLDASGARWRQRPGSGRDEPKETAAHETGALPADRSLFWRSLAAGEENFVEVEATAAQLDATLAGLKAQPRLFRSFSVQPNAEAFRGAARVPVADEKNRLSPQSAVEKSPLAAPFKPEQQAEHRLRPRPLAAPPARQRVLFVLQVVGDHPPEIRARDETKIDVAPPAEPAAPSGNAPQPRK